ncbi:MAG: hypothetical protein C5B47_06130 [Verrucomicrobia bacterium]|nr:MAG: hypothetical protein C5B47_06130 [Verrucomicrobiota bacterium]
MKYIKTKGNYYETGGDGNFSSSGDDFKYGVGAVCGSGTQAPSRGIPPPAIWDASSQEPS